MTQTSFFISVQYSAFAGPSFWLCCLWTTCIWIHCIGFACFIDGALPFFSWLFICHSAAWISAQPNYHPYSCYVLTNYTRFRVNSFIQCQTGAPNACITITMWKRVIEDTLTARLFYSFDSAPPCQGPLLCHRSLRTDLLFGGKTFVLWPSGADNAGQTEWTVGITLGKLARWWEATLVQTWWAIGVVCSCLLRWCPVPDPILALETISFLCSHTVPGPLFVGS